MDRSSYRKFSFSHFLFKTDPFSRSLGRIISYTFFVILVGGIISFMISDFSPIKWLGALLIIILLDFAFHFKSSPYFLKSLYSDSVPDNNVALCFDRESLRSLLLGFEKVDFIGGNFYLAVLLFLSEKTSILRSLDKLDVSCDEFKKIVEKEFEVSVKQSDKKLSRDELMNIVSELSSLAAFLANSHFQKNIDNEALFSAVCFSNDQRVAKILDLVDVSADDIDASWAFSRFSKTQRGIPKYTAGFAFKNSGIKSHRANRTLTSRPTPNLDLFSSDLTEFARMGEAGLLIGHQKEYEMMIDVLSRQGNRNILLIGEAGVGREAMTKHLAFQIINDNVPEPLFDRRLIELSISDLISGASYEELSLRFNNVVKEIISAGNIILYIPDIHNLSKTSDGEKIDLLDLLSPILSSDLFPVIGATYPREFKEYIETRSDFSSKFDLLRVDPISEQDAIYLLAYDALILEKKYGVSIKFTAIKEAVSLAYKYLKSKPLPSSAQDVLKEVAVDANQKQIKEIGADDVVAIVERKVSIPIHRTTKEEASELLNLEEFIHKTFIDQEEAVGAVSQALRAYRTGLSRKGGPIASFLFVGPTGVGKTELSKTLSKIHFGSDKFMFRFDMSEYQNKENIVRFLGSSDGKIAGGLTEAVIQKPHSLILLDEFEKAHPDILNIFLQVFDDGRLTDALGRVVDFQNTIIIATSNANSLFIQENIRSGKKIEDFSDELKKKLSEFFKPELINRFSDVVVFKPLSQEDIRKIAKLNLSSFSALLADAQGIDLSFDDEVVFEVAKLGFDPVFGARPLRKVIDSKIKSFFSEKILSGEIQRGNRINIRLDEKGEFIFK